MLISTKKWNSKTPYFQKERKCEMKGEAHFLEVSCAQQGLCYHKT